MATAALPFHRRPFLQPGAMRLSHHHTTTLHYCRELGIELVAFPNLNEACWVRHTGFGKLRVREARVPVDRYGTSGLGVVIGYYHFGSGRSEFDHQSPAEREKRALAENSSTTPRIR